MDDAEERSQEIEALQSIFPEEFEVLSPDTFKLTISAQPPSTRSLALFCSLPADYPSKNVPVFDLEGDWLPEEDLRACLETLEGMFVPGEVVIFHWAEWLRERVAQTGNSGELCWCGQWSCILA